MYVGHALDGILKVFFTLQKKKHLYTQWKKYIMVIEEFAKMLHLIHSI